MGPAMPLPASSNAPLPKRFASRFQNSSLVAALGPARALQPCFCWPWITLIEAASSTSSSGQAVFQPTPSQEMARRLIASQGPVGGRSSSHHPRFKGDPQPHAPPWQGPGARAQGTPAGLHGRGLVKRQPQTISRPLRDAQNDINMRAAKDIINLDKDHKVPFTLRA